VAFIGNDKFDVILTVHCW